MSSPQSYIHTQLKEEDAIRLIVEVVTSRFTSSRISPMGWHCDPSFEIRLQHWAACRPVGWFGVWYIRCSTASRVGTFAKLAVQNTGARIGMPITWFDPLYQHYQHSGLPTLNHQHVAWRPAREVESETLVPTPTLTHTYYVCTLAYRISPCELLCKREIYFWMHVDLGCLLLTWSRRIPSKWSYLSADYNFT